MIPYHSQLIDSKGFVHSIDMIYIEYYSLVNFDSFISHIRSLHDKYASLKYEEYLDRLPCSRYDFYNNNIVFGFAHLDFGKYVKYDHCNKEFDIFNMFKLRINPNKYFNCDWFQELLSYLTSVSVESYILKYDYSIDVPYPIDSVHVFGCRKEYSYYKGTYYYGSFGRPGFLKIYNKSKELSKQDVVIPDTTRIEYTFVTKKDVKFDDVYIFNNSLTDCSNLKDTDKAIVDMYRLLTIHHINYDLKLGYKKNIKLSPYLYGSFFTLDYGDYLSQLLKKAEIDFNINTSSPGQLILDQDGFIDVSSADDLPFD